RARSLSSRSPRQQWPASPCSPHLRSGRPHRSCPYPPSETVHPPSELFELFCHLRLLHDTNCPVDVAALRLQDQCDIAVRGQRGTVVAQLPRFGHSTSANAVKQPGPRMFLAELSEP